MTKRYVTIKAGQAKVGDILHCINSYKYAYEVIRKDNNKVYTNPGSFFHVDNEVHIEMDVPEKTKKIGKQL